MKIKLTMRGVYIMPAGFQLKKLTNGEEIWKLWHGVDQPQDMSLAQIYAKYKHEGNINPKTGKPVTRAGLCISAWVWAFDNINTAIPQWMAAWEQHGEFYSREDGIKIFIERARHIYKYNLRKFDRFITKNNLQEYVK
ncbi:MAG: hypothetical protein MUO21_05585 [Nitrososphaeraceae archaeon]|nr:hypothetical protein [Nitrososphaeraceae archaeon]